MWLVLLGCRESDPGPPVAISDERVPDNVLARVIRLRGRRVPDTRLVCEGKDVVDEMFVVDLGPLGGADEVFLAGLLAETTYSCSVDGESSEEAHFTTDALPEDLPEASLVEDGAAGGPYLLMNHGTDLSDDRQTKFLIYDDRGRLRHYHFLPVGASDLDVSYLGGGEILYGGGYAASPTVVDLDRTVAQQAPGPFEAYGRYHHTVERLADGTFLAAETSRNSDPDDPANVWTGFAIERLSSDLQAREWVLNSQELVNDGTLGVGHADNLDPYHLNALQWMEDEGQVAASLYRISKVALIDVDRREMIERIGWNTEWILRDVQGQPLPDEEWFFGQHALELDPVPGGSVSRRRLLLHDNGVDRPDGTLRTRIVEYELDKATQTAVLTWEWSQPGWFEPIWGDVDRLADGRISITHAHCQKCTNLVEQRTEVILVDPGTDSVDWRLRFAGQRDASYRSEWLTDCSIFHRVSACD
jgi:hypothetical protein